MRVNAGLLGILVLVGFSAEALAGAPKPVPPPEDRILSWETKALVTAYKDGEVGLPTQESNPTMLGDAEYTVPANATAEVEKTKAEEKMVAVLAQIDEDPNTLSAYESAAYGDPDDITILGFCTHLSALDPDTVTIQTKLIAQVYENQEALDADEPMDVEPEEQLGEVYTFECD